jgi:hypothetical protein
MKGLIKSYCPADKAGVIECVEGNKYEFKDIDWQDEVPPASNQNVIFRKNGQRAIEIVTTPN